jgi:hypothetical protein
MVLLITVPVFSISHFLSLCRKPVVALRRVAPLAAAVRTTMATARWATWWIWTLGIPPRRCAPRPAWTPGVLLYRPPPLRWIPGVRPPSMLLRVGVFLLCPVYILLFWWLSRLSDWDTHGSAWLHWIRIRLALLGRNPPGSTGSRSRSTWLDKIV